MVVDVVKAVDLIDKVVVNLSEVVIEALDKVDEVVKGVVAELIDVDAAVGVIAPIVVVVFKVDAEIELDVSVNFEIQRIEGL